MKINESKIIAASNLNPTKRSQTMSITELSKRIEDGNITIPSYQRGLSWNDDKAVALFNYQLFGKAPVSPISLNEIGHNDDVPQLSFISRERLDKNEPNKNKLSVVDGQQRLTTNYKAYSNDKSFEHIVFDVTQARFRKLSGGIHNNQIPVGILLNKDQQKLTKYIFDNNTQNNSTKLFQLMIGVHTKMLNYMYTIHIADDMTEDEQIQWFEVLNNAGTRVSAIELSLSKMKMHDFDLYGNFIEPYKELVSKYGFAELFSPFSSNVSYPIASLNPAYEVYVKEEGHKKNYAPIPSDTKENQLIKLNKDELEIISKRTIKSLNKALDFIKNNSLESYISRMQYVMYLTGYFVFQDNIKEKDLVQWVKNINFDDTTNGIKRNIFDKLINNDFN